MNNCLRVLAAATSFLIRTPAPALASHDVCDDINGLVAFATGKPPREREMAFEASGEAGMARGFEADVNSADATVAYRRASESFYQAAKMLVASGQYSLAFCEAFLAYNASLEALATNERSHTFNKDDLIREVNAAEALAHRYRNEAP